MKTVKIKTSELTGMALSYAVAVAEGYLWARNMSRRSGDSFRKESQAHWPLGSRCLVSPSKSKNLHPTKVNWDGWCSPDGTEPLAHAAFYDVPNFVEDWSQVGLIIDRERIGVNPQFDGQWLAFSPHKPDKPLFAPTPLMAVMRYYVAGKLGDEVEVPEELL